MSTTEPVSSIPTKPSQPIASDTDQSDRSTAWAFYFFMGSLVIAFIAMLAISLSFFI